MLRSLSATLLLMLALPPLSACAAGGGGRITDADPIPVREGATLVPHSARGLHIKGLRYVDIDEDDVTSPVVMSFRRNEVSPELPLLRSVVTSCVAEESRSLLS